MSGEKMTEEERYAHNSSIAKKIMNALGYDIHYELNPENGEIWNIVLRPQTMISDKESSHEVVSESFMERLALGLGEDWVLSKTEKEFETIIKKLGKLLDVEKEAIAKMEKRTNPYDETLNGRKCTYIHALGSLDKDEQRLNVIKDIKGALK